MLIVTIASLAVCAAFITQVATRRHSTDAFAGLRLRLQALYLPSTRITIDPSQLGHIISVNDDLQLIRHASGRLAYLPVRRHTPQRRPMPHVLKALLLTFFTL